MTPTIIVAIIAVVILALVVAAAFFLGGFSVSSGPRQTLDEARAWQQERYDTSFYDTCDGGEYTVEGADGYILHAKLLKSPVPSDRYVIISHGYTDNRMGALKYARIYLGLGFNCVIYDLRGHGLNAPAATTYGILESRDLVRVIEDTRERYPGITQLGLQGESLGAATTVAVLAYGPEVDFAVADCGFSDIEGVLRAGYRNAGVPVFLVDLADLHDVARHHRERAVVGRHDVAAVGQARDAAATVGSHAGIDHRDEHRARRPERHHGRELIGCLADVVGLDVVVEIVDAQLGVNRLDHTGEHRSPAAAEVGHEHDRGLHLPASLFAARGYSPSGENETVQSPPKPMP